MIIRSVLLPMATYGGELDVSLSATDEPLLPSAKRTRVDYSTGNYTGFISPASKNNHNFALRPSIYKEISVKHFLDDSTPNKLKQMCVGGSDKRVISPTIYSGRPVGIYQTNNYDKDVTIIKIENFSGVAMSEIIASLNKNLSSVSTITDISTREDTKTGCFNLYDKKALFKKSDSQAEIPNY
ncbi:hypothetical protein BB561_003864 [Smittium simulii]|uniref:Uncharacterized protein n=1 Tax=Smittium simulii TaxID=133385 RepID=A0A2T9YJ80_9FUNG|nr:hypothetical protein BB561_003864 [Smittium simulii]